MTQPMDFAALANAAAAAGPNTTEAASVEFTIPKAGPTRLRLVAYVEIGEHQTEYEGVKKQVKQAQLTFELSGPNHPPRVDEETGEKTPTRTTITLTLSRNEKAGYFKLFKQMNVKGTATHFAQLVGQPFRGRVYHTIKEKDGKKVTYWGLKDPDTKLYAIGAPVSKTIDADDNEVIVPIEVDPPISTLKLFVWDTTDEARLKMMWDMIFIDGEYGQGENKRSANVFQNKIKQALNFSGSPIDLLLKQGGKPLELGEAKGGAAAAAAAKTKRSQDPMDDIPY